MSQVGRRPLRIFSAGDLAAQLVLAAAFVFLFTTGGFIAGVALHDPDTCWLLGLGRWIIAHHQLPVSDPFSYTFAGSGRPLVLYQWLFEVLFYSLYWLGGLGAVIVATALILITAFIVVPLRMLLKLQVHPLLALLVVSTAALAASFHFLCRPEIFSYLLESVWLYLLMQINQKLAPDNPAALRLLFFMPLLMVLWANLHSGFVIGLLLLALFIISLIGAAMRSAAGLWKLKLAALLLLLCCLASLLNPWGLGLWQYLPSLFFFAGNSYINELRPLSWQDVFLFQFFWPYTLLAFGGGIALLAIWRRQVLSARSAGEQNAGRPALSTFPVLLFVAAAVAAPCCRRLVPFCALLMVPGAAMAIDNVLQSGQWERLRKNGSAMATGLLRLLGNTRGWLPSCYALTAAGCILTLYMVPPRLPQATALFDPPWAAIEQLKVSRPPGNMFNDPEFGDVLIWQLSAPPAVFIDSRLDMYGGQIASDYRDILFCRGPWQKLMEKYGIRWIFQPPDAPLVAQLKSQKQWQTLYADSQAVIMSRAD